MVEDLVRNADVVIDNYRPGVLAKFGLDHDALHRVNPAVVTCSLTGYGETGPDAHRAGYDYTIQALAGVMSLAGEPDGPPTKAGISYVDHSGGITAALGVCAALVERAAHRDRDARRSRAVRRADLDADLPRVVAAQPRRHVQRAPRTPRTRRSCPRRTSAPPTVTSRSSSATTACGVGSCRRSAIRSWPTTASRAAKVVGSTATRSSAVCSEILLGATSREWETRLAEWGVACGAVNDVAGALAEPQTHARGLLVRARAPGVRRATSTSAARCRPAAATPWARRRCSASTPARPWRGSGTRRRGSPSSGRRASIA